MHDNTLCLLDMLIVLKLLCLTQITKSIAPSVLAEDLVRVPQVAQRRHVPEHFDFNYYFLGLVYKYEGKSAIFYLNDLSMSWPVRNDQ